MPRISSYHCTRTLAPALAEITSKFPGYRRSSGVDSEKLGPTARYALTEPCLPRSNRRYKAMTLIPPGSERCSYSLAPTTRR
jgi:hypothetical protein